MTTPISAPGADEFAPYYAGYIARLAHVDPVAEISAQRDRMRAFLSALTDEQAMHRYAPGKWSVKELVNHLTDAERVFAYRLMRVGRGDATPLPGFEENDYARAAESDRRPWPDLVDEWLAVREATIRLVSGMPPDAWLRRGVANNAPVSARALLFIILGHTDHHRGVLVERYGLSP